MEMNQLCKVCGEPAAGFHFGAFTCEGCKSFFGRTYNNLSSLSECKNSGRCIINKKNRTSCKSCRLRKCLMVGMSKSGSRYGRRSNWFKIHCLLQDQANLNGQLDGSMTVNGDMTQNCVYDASTRGKSGGGGAVGVGVSGGGGGGGTSDVDCKDDDLMMTGSPADSHSDSCGEMDSIKPLNGCYDASNKVKSGSLSPLSSYESPSPPYDKKDSTTTSTTSSSNYHHHHHHHHLHPLPMSPLSPISPLVAFQQQQKFFGQVAAAGLLPNGFGFHGLANGSGGSSSGTSGNGSAAPLTFRPYAPLSNFDLLLKKRKAFVLDLASSCNSSTITTSVASASASASTAEQEVPIDLSLKPTGADSRVCSESKTSSDGDDDDDDEDDDGDGVDGRSKDGSSDRQPRPVESPLDLTKRS